MKKDKILKNIGILLEMYNKGLLDGEIMPEDENPGLEKSSKENYLYFTLPMALNYQRNSYTLWECAKKTYEDVETNFVFNPHIVVTKSFEEVQAALTKYKLALQKVKQTEIWFKLCNTFVYLYQGDIRELFKSKDVNKIRDFVQVERKRDFPYISGNKICNYWLYVLYLYTDVEYTNIECLTIAPDTHVIKATHRLGLISEEELKSSNIQGLVVQRWNELLTKTKYKPIDIHPVLWLWSRNGFREIERDV